MYAERYLSVLRSKTEEYLIEKQGKSDMSILRKDVNKILIKIKKGDEQSKNVLFEKTYNHLKIIAYPYVYNKDDIEDVLVDAYLRIFQYIDSFDETKDGYNWICKIVQNVARDWGKDIQGVPLEEVTERAQIIDLEEIVATADEVQYLLKDYSERDKQIIYLRFWEDKTIETISLTLNMGKSNVHKRISKILKEIKQKSKNEVEKS